MKHFSVLALLFCATLFVQAQKSFDKQRLDSLFTLLEHENKLMGSAAIRFNDKEIYSRQWGTCTLQPNVKAGPSAVYRIGSITKMFTAVMILQLVEEEKLQTSTLLSDFFPSVPNAEKITIDHLLAHRIGIHNFTNDSVYDTYFRLSQTHAQMIDRISAASPDFEPGTKSAYSNANYVLLGYILEKATGKDYKTNLGQRIVTPLGLNQTFLGAANDPAVDVCMSFKYEDGNLVDETITDMSVPGGAGAILSTPSDLTVFIKALFSYKLIKKSTLNEMIKLNEQFGYGIFEMNFYDHEGLGHTGGIDGFRSSLTYFPADSLSVALCVNAADFNPNEAMIGLLSIYFGKEYTFPSFESALLSSELLGSYTGIYSSPDFPLKITVTLDQDKLFAQATGQSAFPLTPFDEKTFRFDAAGITIVFDQNTLTIRQGGFDIKMTKE